MKKCRNCGALNKSGAETCVNCGRPLNASGPDPAEDGLEVPEETPAPEEPAEEIVSAPAPVTAGGDGGADAPLTRRQQRMARRAEKKAARAAARSSASVAVRPADDGSAPVPAAEGAAPQPPAVPGSVTGPAAKSGGGHVVRNILIWLMAIAVTGCVLYGAYCAFTSPYVQFLKDYKTGDTAAAADIYDESLRSSSFFSGRIRSLLLGDMEQAVRNFTDERISYDEAASALADIRATGVLSDSDMTDSLAAVENLHASRSAYDQAKAAYDGGDYESAVYEARDVIETDANYKAAQRLAETARSAWLDSLLEQTDALTKSRDYAGAIRLLESVSDEFSGESRYTAALTACRNDQEAYAIQQIMDASAADFSAGRYDAAVSALKDGMETYADSDALKTAYTDTLNKLETALLADAASAFSGGDYAKAVRLTDKGLTYLPDSENLAKYKTVYESYIPVSLTALTADSYSESGSLYQSLKTDAFLKDNLSNVYGTSFSATGGEADYLLSKGYTRFSGFVGCPSGLSSNLSINGASLEIYADGTLLYESGLVNALSSAKAFDLDVTGCSHLTLVWKCEGTNIRANWGYYATIFDGALQKVHVEP